MFKGWPGWKDTLRSIYDDLVACDGIPHWGQQLDWITGQRARTFYGDRFDQFCAIRRVWIRRVDSPSAASLRGCATYGRP